jgi:hypothetical protein
VLLVLAALVWLDLRALAPVKPGRTAVLDRHIPVDVLNDGVALTRLSFVMAFGAEAQGDRETGELSITKGGTRLRLHVGRRLMEMDGATAPLAEPPRVEFFVRKIREGCELGAERFPHIDKSVLEHLQFWGVTNSDGFFRGYQDWYGEDAVVVPVRRVAEALGAKVKHRVKDWSSLPERHRQLVPEPEVRSFRGADVPPPIRVALACETTSRARATRRRQAPLTMRYLGYRTVWPIVERSDPQVKVSGSATPVVRMGQLHTQVRLKVECRGKHPLTVCDGSVWAEREKGVLESAGYQHEEGWGSVVLTKGQSFELEGTFPGVPPHIIYADGWHCWQWHRKRGQWVPGRHP